MSAVATMAERPMSLAEVASLLSLPAETVLGFMAIGGFPFDAVQFRHSKIMEWLERCPRALAAQPKPAGGAWWQTDDIAPMDAPLTGGVYAIGAATGHIKIGKTWNIRHRLIGLRTGNPSQLDLLAILSTDESDERRFQDLVWEHRASGEWFHPHPSVLQLVRVARSLT